LSLLRAKGAYLFAVVFDRDSFSPAERPRANLGNQALLAGLMDLDAHCVQIRRGDELTELFNR
jgi:hypothetical protein